MSLKYKLDTNKIKQEMVSKYKYKTIMMAPTIQKVVINRGLGEAMTNSKALEVSLMELERITGQKPIVTRAKKAISNFKIKEKYPIGCAVTLRSKKMKDFLVKLINLALPKIRDFRGVPINSFDGRGNYTLGIKESLIFPEINYDQIDKIRGFDITIVTSAKTDDEARDLLILYGMPFRKK
ncbi:50S ribosomal protein L5 [Candidatus Margulisiibacteriota bacterium]